MGSFFHGRPSSDGRVVSFFLQKKNQRPSMTRPRPSWDLLFLASPHGPPFGALPRQTRSPARSRSRRGPDTQSHSHLPMVQMALNKGSWVAQFLMSHSHFFRVRRGHKFWSDASISALIIRLWRIHFFGVVFSRWLNPQDSKTGRPGR